MLARIEERVAAIPRLALDDPRSIARYYNPAELPCVRWLCGLAEGADAVGANELLRCRSNGVTFELAAVLPCQSSVYRATRDASFVAEFDRLLGSCAYVVEGDGELPAHSAGLAAADEEFVKCCRARAYRLQARLLLRQADLLVAAFDFADAGGSGGTRETVREALRTGLPVLVLDLGSLEVSVRLPGDLEDIEWLGLPKWDAVHSARGAGAAPNDWERRLDEIVASVLLGPKSVAEMSIATRRQGLSLLEEYLFGARWDALLPRSAAFRRGSERVLGTLWSRFQRWASDVDAAEVLPTPAPPGRLRAWRTRASSLNSRYSALYRGGFLLNYGLALAAVLLAVLTLIFVSGAESEGARLAVFGGTAFKLCIVLGLLVLPSVANRGRWASRTVEYRYIAEQLRVLQFLPSLGIASLPAVPVPLSSPGYERPTVAEWLLQAFVRNVDLPRRTTGGAPAHTVHLNPAAALRGIRDDWLGAAGDSKSGTPGTGQIGYHTRNEAKMTAMAEHLEKTVRILSRVVVGAVLFDLVAVCVEHWYELPHAVARFAHVATLVLVALGAVLPAAIAALNGVGSQSECERLGDRSAIMRLRLEQHAKSAGTLVAMIEAARTRRHVGSYTLEALDLVDEIGRTLTAEVMDWSVLFAKDMPEA